MSKIHYKIWSTRLLAMAILGVILLILTAGVMMFVTMMRGITKSHIEPLDNESLQLLIVSGKNQPCIVKSLSDPNEDLIYDTTEQQMSGLVAALHPIRSVKVGQLPLNEVDYQLCFQPGMDPIRFMSIWPMINLFIRSDSTFMKVATPRHLNE